jgi:predicted transcriptional regulator of viral defense system
MSATALRRLSPLVRPRFGVFTTADAIAAGISRSTLTRMMRSGDVIRLYRGVYALAVYPRTWQREWMAARLATGAAAAISHRAAAHVLDLQHTGTKRRPELELTIPREGARPATLRGHVTVHTQAHLTDADVTQAGAWRVTTTAWTLASLAHSLGYSRTERAVGAAIGRGQTTTEELAAVTARFRFCAGVLVLRELLTRLSPEIRLTRSEAERLFLRLVRQAGLPMPKVNLRVHDARGGTRYLDFAWPEWGVCVEIDVHPDHEGTIGRSHDGRRQNDLVADWRPLHFDDFDLQFEPEYVISEVRRVLRKAGAPI